MIRMEQQLGRPVLIEFWDFCRPNSIHTLPYLKAWHERYEAAGLRVIGVHSSGFVPSQDPEAVRSAVERLGIAYPVVIDIELEIWQLYGNLGWPARYLFTQEGMLADYHYGEGAYEETERAIQELLGLDGRRCRRCARRTRRTRCSPCRARTFKGYFAAGTRQVRVWAVLDGHGSVTVGARTFTVEHPGCYELLSHAHSTAGELELELGEGVRCHAVCFTPGLAT